MIVGMSVWLLAVALIAVWQIGFGMAQMLYKLKSFIPGWFLFGWGVLMFLWSLSRMIFRGF